MPQEILAEQSITYEYPPDGGKLPIIDPYDGCSLQCPYCFQRTDPEWNRDIYIKTNLPMLIRDQLSDWPRDQVIFIGSRCDPYMPLEQRYELTRQCLIELNRLKISCMIVTKSQPNLIERDMDIFKAFSGKFTLLLGLSNINQHKNATSCSTIPNIEAANRFHRAGVKVWTFITPVLPGITDVKAMIHALDPDIPVHLDRVRLEQNSPSAKLTLDWIGRDYPHLFENYQSIVESDEDPYYNSLKKDLAGNRCVHFVFE